MNITMQNHGLNLEERHAENLAEFTEQLAQSRFWHVLPEGESDVLKSTGLFDAQNSLLYPSVAALRTFCTRHSFVYIRNLNEESVLATLHNRTKLLWSNGGNNHSMTALDGSLVSNTASDIAQIFRNKMLYATFGDFIEEGTHRAFGVLTNEKGRETAKQGNWAGLKGWSLPTKDQLLAFATQDGNPHRGGHGNCLLTPDGKFKGAWLTKTGSCDLGEKSFPINQGGSGYLFAVHDFWANASAEEMLADMSHRGWRLVSPNAEAFQPDTRWCGLSVEKLHASLVLDRVHLLSAEKEGLTLNPSALWIDNFLVELDYTPCRLPKLESAQLTDPGKGVWELWEESPESLERFGLVARDPGQDVQRRAVAIDFGTSSTVVAMDTVSGGRELLRIGVRDFYQAVQPQHFENPTVLECLDFSAFEKTWTECAYRPELDWNWMRAAHEAQASFRDNPGDTQILASILPRLKQWALRSEGNRVRMTDRLGREVELAAYSERNPVRGQALTVSSDDPFDPIELYAWYLGMAINWRGRGIFLQYYLSFPVKYPREVKERILASFRRGLQRSLPQSLINHHPQVLNDFEVNDLASEPAAYAAAALPHLGVKPTEEGVPYAVFDFGGGTTDFDFGLLRWATTGEEDLGYEQVFEHLASSGDNYLGGENLLEHLVYECFQQNLEALRSDRIQFTKPLDAKAFAGSEAFLASTQAAQTNTVMLAARLRSFLEGEHSDLPPQIKLDLIDGQGNKKTCELVLDAEALDNLLASRIRRGVEAFLSELASLCPDLPGSTPIQVLLAGNGSRSRHIKALFDMESELWQELLEQAFDGTPPDIVVHQPLPIDEACPHAPTTKTGVALGLLRLSPGKNVLLKNHVSTRHDGQAPFAWFAGRLRRGCLEPALSPSVNYGQWHEMGRLQEGIFYLNASTSPRAHAGLSEGDPELKAFRLSFPAAPAGARLFARAVTPNTIELSAVIDQSELETHSVMRFILE